MPGDGVCCAFALQVVYATADEADAYMFHRCFFVRPPGTISSGRASVLPQMFFFL